MLSLNIFSPSSNMPGSLKNYLINRLVLFATLTFAVFTLNLSCSDDSDELQTFLEMYDGTVWLLSNDNIDTTVYIRLNNNKSILIEEWDYYNSPDCYGYWPNIFDCGNFEYIENSIEKLIVQYDDCAAPFESMTFTIHGDTLKIVITFSEWEEETVYFNKSSVSVDDFEVCDDNVLKPFINTLKSNFRPL